MPRWAALLAALLVLPSLAAGLAFDDHFQRRRAQGTDLLGSLLLTALLSAEAAFGAAALFVAYALCLERGSLLKRAAWCLHGWMLVEAR